MLEVIHHTEDHHHISDGCISLSSVKKKKLERGGCCFHRCAASVSVLHGSTCLPIANLSVSCQQTFPLPSTKSIHTLPVPEIIASTLSVTIILRYIQWAAWEPNQNAALLSFVGCLQPEKMSFGGSLRQQCVKANFKVCGSVNSVSEWTLSTNSSSLLTCLRLENNRIKGSITNRSTTLQQISVTYLA